MDNPNAPLPGQAHRSTGPLSAIQPGWFYTLRFLGAQKGAEFRDANSGCRTGNTVWGLRDYVDTEPGHMEEPTEDGSKLFQATSFGAVLVDGFDSNGEVQARFVRLTGLDPSPHFDPTEGGSGTRLSVPRIVE